MLTSEFLQHWDLANCLCRKTSYDIYGYEWKEGTNHDKPIFIDRRCHIVSLLTLLSGSSCIPEDLTRSCRIFEQIKLNSVELMDKMSSNWE